jgi:chromosome partitioning protein
MSRSLPPYLTLPETPARESAAPITVEALPLSEPPAPPSALPGHEKADLRLFSTWEICQYILPMAPGHLRRVLRETPDLPQGRSSDGEPGSARWFTLEEVFALRRHFIAASPRGRRFAPPRPAGPPAHVLAMAQLGRGMGRSTGIHHLAASAAMDGYRVLVLDLDPDAALTARLAGVPSGAAEPGLLALVARHAGSRLRQENRRRLDRGEAPLAMEAAMDRAMDRSLTEALQPCRWPGVDLLGAGPALHRLAWQAPLWQGQIPGWQPWAALRDSLRGEGVLARYDLILIDTPPDMGLLSQMALAAADSVLVPLTADAAGRGWAMAEATLAQMAALFRDIEARETRIARALGRRVEGFSWGLLRLLVTRADPVRGAAERAALQAALGPRLLPQPLAESALIGSGAGQAPCLYELDYRDSSRPALTAARSSFDALYAAVKAAMLARWQAQAAGQTTGR